MEGHEQSVTVTDNFSIICHFLNKFSLPYLISSIIVNKQISSYSDSPTDVDQHCAVAVWTVSGFTNEQVLVNPMNHCKKVSTCREGFPMEWRLPIVQYVLCMVPDK